MYLAVHLTGYIPQLSHKLVLRFYQFSSLFLNAFTAPTFKKQLVPLIEMEKVQFLVLKCLRGFTTSSTWIQTKMANWFSLTASFSKLQFKSTGVGDNRRFQKFLQQFNLNYTNIQPVAVFDIKIHWFLQQVQMLHQFIQLVSKVKLFIL